MQKIIRHEGVARKSGRYPWGSGKNPEQRNKSFEGQIEDLRKKGMTDAEIAKGFKMSRVQMQAEKARLKERDKQAKATMARRLKDKGYSNVEIGRRLGGINESSVRDMLKDTYIEKAKITENISNALKENVAKKRYLDVGAGTEHYLGVTRTKLDKAIANLQKEGYQIHYAKVPQLGTNHETWLKVLTDSTVDGKEMYANRDNIKTISSYSEDGGRSILGLEPVRSIDSKKIQIRYHEDGGSDKDGVIEIRRGVPELTLNKRYAQVRIAVDDTHYLKGMAIHNDDMPPGVDIIFNTNKSNTTPKMKVLKPMANEKTGEIDPDNPFGAMVRQTHYIDKDGKSQLSALNVVGYKDNSGEEGAWGEWSKTLSSQMLSKQKPELAKKQLGLAYDAKKQEFDELKTLSNPEIKKKLLETFSEGCDSSSVSLKAAALPRQQSHVIMPVPSLKDTEVYAPNYNNGERVVLIRYPHGGIFEIPELTVNNNHPPAKKMLGKAADAIGINPNVAKQLSGADFDGDTVLVIPNSPSVGIKTKSIQKDLAEFEPRISYPPYEGMVRMTPEIKGRKMGDVSNLITDMTVKGAPLNEVIRAVRHSMVVIDAEKHSLDYKQSYIDHGIAELKKTYQGGPTRGAATLISKASADKRVLDRKDRYKIDPKTGKKIYELTGESYYKQQVSIDPDTGKKVYTPVGKPIMKLVKSTKMAEEEDAYALSSGTIMENVYATHANKLKALANEARKELINTKKAEYNPAANKAYKVEVDELKAQLMIASRNAPLERQATILANASLKAKIAANPDLKGAELKKVKGALITEMRNRVGAKKEKITISDRQWEAIQAGAISNNLLSKILNNTDLDALKQRAMPRLENAVPPAKVQRAKLMLKAGRTQAEIAQQLGLSVTTVRSIINE